ncbi:MAG: hypothetical protein ACRDEB_09170, partial [Chitinophagaceae bacterium]
NEFITSKLMDVLIISCIITLLYTVVSLVTGFSNTSGMVQNIWSQAYYIGLFGLQTFAQLSIAFLIGFIVRKAFLALGIFLFYYIILENLVVGLLKWKNLGIGHYMPLEISDKLIPPPGFFRLVDPDSYQRSMDDIKLHIFLTIILTTVIWLICYRINAKRDLK